MSQKKIKKQIEDTVLKNVDPKLLELPDIYEVKRGSGEEQYSLALQSLLDKIKQDETLCSPGTSPELIAQKMIDVIANFIANLMPNNCLNANESAAIFGAVLGGVMGIHIEEDQASLEDVEKLVDCFYVALREATVKGIVISREIQKKNLIVEA